MNAYVCRMPREQKNCKNKSCFCKTCCNNFARLLYAVVATVLHAKSMRDSSYFAVLICIEDSLSKYNHSILKNDSITGWKLKRKHCQKGPIWLGACLTSFDSFKAQMLMLNKIDRWLNCDFGNDKRFRKTTQIYKQNTLRTNSAFGKIK